MEARSWWRGRAQTLLILLVVVPSSSFSPRLFTTSPATLLGGSLGQLCQLRPPHVALHAQKSPCRGASLPSRTISRATSRATEAEAVVGADEEGGQAAAAEFALQAFREFYTAQGICPGGDAEVHSRPPKQCHSSA